MFSIIKNLFDRIKSKPEQGQSLVEMAIITPLLLFLLLGVFEVGYMVRSYLTLVNVNREITRFAVRPGYLDFSEVSTIDASYQAVREWVDVSLGEQLELDFSDTGNATLIVSHVVVDTGFPCENMNNCDCDDFDDPSYNPYPDDDIIVHPGKPGMWYQAKRYGPAETVTGERNSRIDYDALVTQELIPQNNKFNCELIKKGGVASANNLVITELFIDEPQLFGFPFISNPYTDPLLLYSQTTMRLVSGARDLLNNIDTVGPVCMAYPITFSEDIFADPDNPSVPQVIDAYEGSSPGNFGWITWNPDPGNNNAGYVEKELKIPQLSMNDYTNVLDSTDHSLSIGDAVSTKPGIANSNGIDEQLQLLVGQEIIIPVYNNNPGNGQNSYYEVSHFAKIQVNQICLPRNGKKCDGENNKQIKATFLGYVDDTCSDAGPAPTGGGNNPPAAQSDFAATSKDDPVTIDLLANDSDPDGDAISIDPNSITAPDKGTVVDNGDGTVTYTPKNNNSGLGTFTFDYTITDGNGNTDSATVTVEVTATSPTSTPTPTDSPTAAPTNTPLPNANTPTPTSTPVSPTPTSTPQATNTPAPTSTPAPTDTPVPSPTNTPAPPSPTPTPVPVSTTLPWVERFDLGDGTSSDNGSTAWDTDKKGAGGEFEVNNKVFEISNTQKSFGGSSPTWKSEEIDINGVNDVEISIDVKSTGNMTRDEDYIYIYYIIDGKWDVLEGYNGKIPGNGFKTFSQKNLSGQTLQFVIFGSTSSNSKSYFIDNIVVNGESTTPSTPITYQAEEANMGGGTTVDANHSGYNGSGFVNFPGSGGYVEYQNVDGGSGGSRTLVFRFALGASARTGSLIVNGNSQNITFQSTGAWDSWSTMNVTVNLNSGTGNTIRVESTGQDLANLDEMMVN